MKQRLAGVLVLLVLASGGCYFARSLGSILHAEDPLQKADVIYVLAGTRVERVAEGGHLLLEGWAPIILLSRQTSEPAEVRLRAAGVVIPTETQMQRDVLVQMGVPRDAIHEVTAEQVATANEVEELAQLAVRRQWSRIIVVTSKFHTARAALALRRRLGPLDKQVVVRASRYDEADVERWWSNRSDLRFALFESQKLVAYWVGIGD